MMTRSKSFSLKRKISEENQPSVEIKAKKTSFIGIPQAELITLFDQYKSFLMDKKREGTGFLTHLDSRQENRSAQIEMLENAFKNISEQQTFGNWKALLILLVQYRIEVYTENFIPKTKSTFGDALWAVQEHLLQQLTNALSTNPHCEMLTEIMQHTQNETLCSAATATAETETKILKAAFGHYSVLASDYPPLEAVTEAVTAFVTEIDQPAAEALLEIDQTYGSSSSAFWDVNGEQQQGTSPSIVKKG